MSPLEDALVRILVAILETLGPALVRRHVDEWEAARDVSNAKFRAKFSQDP